MVGVVAVGAALVVVAAVVVAIGREVLHRDLEDDDAAFPSE